MAARGELGERLEELRVAAVSRDGKDRKEKAGLGKSRECVFKRVKFYMSGRLLCIRVWGKVRVWPYKGKSISLLIPLRTVVLDAIT